MGQEVEGVEEEAEPVERWEASRSMSTQAPRYGKPLAGRPAEEGRKGSPPPLDDPRPFGGDPAEDPLREGRDPERSSGLPTSPHRPARRSLSVKPHPRVFAFDDAPFGFEQDRTAVVGVVVVLPSYVEGVLRGEVEVDGTDATDVLVDLIKGTPHREATRAILLGGIALGGFNVVDLTRLHQATGLPVVTVARRAPDLQAMVEAIRKHLPQRPDLLKLLTAHELFTVPLRPRPLWVAAVGLTRKEATDLVLRSLVRGSFPEPLRLAHLMASLVPGGPPSRSRA